MERIYLDNAATTAVRSEVLAAMLPFFDRQFANPSSMHASGQRVRHALEQARRRTGAALNAHADEIVFTGGGSEADNLALFGLTSVVAPGRDEVITSAIEHHAVLHAADALKRRGMRVTLLPVDAEGFVRPQTLRGAISSRTAVVSIMLANNEIGTIEPIAELAATAHEHGALFHSDAVQAVGHIPVDVLHLVVDALSLSAHKFEGPKGVGALYLRRGIKLEPLIFGGGQEDGRRSGTENVPGIIGLSVALTLAVEDLPSTAPARQKLRDYFIERVCAEIPDTALNGAAQQRLPNNINLRFAGIEADAVVVGLDLAGIDVSTGSACSSGSQEPSHVLSALGLPASQARGCIRFSLGRSTTMEQLQRVIAALVPLVARLRALSGALLSGGAEAT